MQDVTRKTVVFCALGRGLLQDWTIVNRCNRQVQDVGDGGRTISNRVLDGWHGAVEIGDRRKDIRTIGLDDQDALLVDDDRLSRGVGGQRDTIRLEVTIHLEGAEGERLAHIHIGGEISQGARNRMVFRGLIYARIGVRRVVDDNGQGVRTRRAAIVRGGDQVTHVIAHHQRRGSGVGVTGYWVERVGPEVGNGDGAHARNRQVTTGVPGDTVDGEGDHAEAGAGFVTVDFDICIIGEDVTTQGLIL